MDILKQMNDRTSLAEDQGQLYILKRLDPGDFALYETLQQLDNPYVVKVHKTILLQDNFYAVQDYVPGVTLAEYLKAAGPLEEMETRRLLLQVCSGLQSIHALGIVHRDINPNNLILKTDGTLCIIDFGISRMQKPDAGSDTQILGTQGYAAPEQFGFRQTTPRTDIYALGVLMNYMMTLSMPNEQMASGSLAPVIQKCLQMDEQNRYADVAELRVVLEQKAEKTAFWKRIPGFRQGVLWHKVVAVLYYLLATFFLVVAVVAGQSFYQSICYFLCFAAVLVLPVLIIFNVGNWLEKWSYTQRKDIKNKHITQGLLLVVCVLVSFVFIIIS